MIDNYQIMQNFSFVFKFWYLFKKNHRSCYMNDDSPFKIARLDV